MVNTPTGELVLHMPNYFQMTSDNKNKCLWISL